MSEEEQTRRVLGVVEYAHVEGDALPRWCRVRPEYIAASGNQWLPISKRIEQFPTEGLVYWYAPRHVTPKDSLWRLDLCVLPDRTRKDHWGVLADERAPVFVDLPSVADGVELRRALSSGTLADQRPVAAFLFVIDPETRRQVVGPIELDKRRGDTGFLRVHDFNVDDVQELTIDGEQVFVLRPESDIGGSTGLFNTQNDEQLILGVLKRLRRFDRVALEGTEITQSLLQKYVDALGTADLIGDGALREVSREKALRALVGRVDSEVAARQEIAKVLAALPGMGDELQEAIEEAIKARTGEIDTEARKELADLIHAVDTSTTELGELQARLVDAKKGIEDAKSDFAREDARLSEFRARLRAELEQEIQKIIADPIAALAREPIVSALTSGNASRPPLRVSESEPGKELDSFSGLRGALLSRVTARGLDSEVMLTCLASLCCGTPVLLAGVSAAIYAQILAQVLAGANRRTVQMPADVFGLDDLFHLVAVPAGVDLEPVDLGEVLNQSRLVESLMCIEFRGVNRAPFESGFLSLVEPLASRERVLPWRKRGGEQTSVTVDPHTVLVGTLVPGPSTFRIPAQLRGMIALIRTEPGSPPDPISSEVTTKDWFVRARNFVKWGNDANDKNTLIVGEAIEALPRFQFSGSANREIAVFRYVFEQRESALGHWLISRFGGVVEKRVLLDAAYRLGGDEAVQVIEEADKRGGLDQLYKLIEPEE